jgi:hypothetical protein
MKINAVLLFYFGLGLRYLFSLEDSGLFLRDLDVFVSGTD